MERLLGAWVEGLSHEASDGSTLRDSLQVLDALSALCPFSEIIRLGFYVVPVRGPSRFFGGEEAVMKIVRETIYDITGHDTALGIADGLFCCELAARQQRIVAPGATDSFRRVQSLDVLGRKDLATTCRRLGLHTLGAFADLDAGHVGERFNKHALELHRVARGELAELATQRDTRLPARLARLRGEDVNHDEQLGFFGQRGAGDDRAFAAAHRLRRRLGADAVMVAQLCGGRVPEDRATLVPWGSPVSEHRDLAPWPGQIRSPSPTTTLCHPVAVELRDANDVPVTLSARGVLSAEPVTLLLTHYARRTISWYAGPWPLIERWWVLNRRRAHVQLVLALGEAVLLVAEAGRWWLVGIYD
jgi:nucleotidyltransferase/DNA polymerase involved in DNA repair